MRCPTQRASPTRSAHFWGTSRPLPRERRVLLADSRNQARGIRKRVPIIAVTNQKGGVGKTTSTLNLGAALRELGKTVLLVDLDPQGSLTVAAGVVDVDAVQMSVGELLMARAQGAPIDVMR